MAIVTGTAPLAVKYIWFNGVPYPITWTSITAWLVAVPLQQGSNQFNIVGADIHNQPVAGASATTSATYSFPLASPVGQIVINEIMFNPATSGAEYVERKGKGEKAVKEAEKAGLWLVILQFLFNTFRPMIMSLVTKGLTEFVKSRGHRTEE